MLVQYCGRICSLCLPLKCCLLSLGSLLLWQKSSFQTEKWGALVASPDSSAMLPRKSSKGPMLSPFPSQSPLTDVGHRSSCQLRAEHSFCSIFSPMFTWEEDFIYFLLHRGLVLSVDIQTAPSSSHWRWLGLLKIICKVAGEIHGLTAKQIKVNNAAPKHQPWHRFHLKVQRFAAVSLQRKFPSLWAQSWRTSGHPTCFPECISLSSSYLVHSVLGKFWRQNKELVENKEQGL